MAIFLGIDGGGSKTSCAIGDEHSLLGTGTGGGSNVVRVGEPRARESLRAAISQACGVAKVAPTQIVRTCVGVGGGARSEIATVVRALMAELVSGEVEVVGDMVIALQAAFGRGPGVIVVAGTGSISYGRNADGKTARSGGWGFAISDEGSGHWIGRSAVAAVMRTYDVTGGGVPSRLLESVMKSWGVTTREQMIVAANAAPSPDFAALLPAVLAASESGDATARAVLTQAGAELAALADITIGCLFGDAEPAPVAMAGGVFRNCAQVRQEFDTRLRTAHPQVFLNPVIIDPVRGALEMARKGAQVR